MINIKVTTCAPTWPWQRQIPKGSTDWGQFRFHIDSEIDECDFWFVFESMPKPEKVKCPYERTVFITGEPDSIGSYKRIFLDQFHYVVTGRKDIEHPRVIRTQQGHPWFVEKSFDELMVMLPPAKTKDICIVTSSKAFTEGHRARLRFIEEIQKKFGNKVDVYGRGIRDFESKWDVLSSYKYSIVLENFIGNDFITEKLPDAWLAYCIPFYSGCTNIANYYSQESMINIDITSPIQSLEIIQNVIGTELLYEKYLKNVVIARQEYLLNNQFFAILKNIATSLISTTSPDKKDVQLLPQNEITIWKLISNYWNIYA